MQRNSLEVMSMMNEHYLCSVSVGILVRKIYEILLVVKSRVCMKVIYELVRAYETGQFGFTEEPESLIFSLRIEIFKILGENKYTAKVKSNELLECSTGEINKDGSKELFMANTLIDNTNLQYDIWNIIVEDSVQMVLDKTLSVIKKHFSEYGELFFYD